MVFCLLALSGSSIVLVAQQNPDKPAPSMESQDVKPAVLVMPTSSQDVALLGTDQRYLDLGTLQTRRRTFFMYGMGVSNSYIDTFEENFPSLNGDQFLWSSHFAIINASDHSSFSIQYAPSAIQSVSGPSIREVFQSGTITFAQPIARNWALQLSSANTYGTDLSRLLSPPGFALNNGVPVSDPSSAFFQFGRGNVLTTMNNAGLTWQRSPSQALHFSVQESYFSVLDAGTSTLSTFAQASYSVATSPRTAFSVGGNYEHRTFSNSNGGCDGYGFSLGISHQFGRYFTLALDGGPEFETPPCNKIRTIGGTYAVSISYPLSRMSRLGLTAGRTFMTNYLANAQYSDIGAVSYARQLSEAFQVTFNSGYARTVRTQTGLSAYVGYFASADLSWKLTRSFSLSTEYRRFEQVSGGPVLGQNVALVSLGWNPLPVRIVK
jgi:hypothetical protein